MTLPRLSALAWIFAAVAAPAVAGDVSLSITGGTLGVGPELAYTVSHHVGLRANATFLNVSHHFDSSDLDYDGQVKLKSGGVMLDVFPFGNGFRLSAGARLNRNDGHVTATPNQSQRVGNMVYTPAMIGTIEGDAGTKDFAPSATIGYASRRTRGFVWSIEAGALFQGRVRLSPLTNSTGLIRQADLDAERADIQDDIDKYKVYPIAQLSLGWRF